MGVTVSHCKFQRPLLTQHVTESDFFIIYRRRLPLWISLTLCAWFAYQYRCELWNANHFLWIQLLSLIQASCVTPVIRIQLHTNTREKLCLSSYCKTFIFITVITLCDICIHLHLCADQVCCLLESWMFVNRAQGGRMLWLPYSLFKAENAPHRRALLFLRSIRHKWNNETRG